MTPKIGCFRFEKGRKVGQKSPKIVGRHYWTFPKGSESKLPRIRFFFGPQGRP